MPSLTLTNPGTRNSYDGDSPGFFLVATESPRHTLTYSLSSAPAGVSVNTATGFVSGSIDDGDDTDSPYSVTATVEDTVTLQSASQTFSWFITQPSVTLTTPGDQSNYDGDVISLSLSASDTASHALTYGASGLPSGLSVNTSTGVISGTIASDADAGGPYSVTVTATDGAADVSASQTFSWAVAQPTITLSSPGDQSDYDGDVTSLGLSASESASHALTYSVSGLPSGLSINSSTGVISGTIASDADASGPYSVTVTATDSAADVSGSQTFSWAVDPAYLDLVQVAQTNVAGETVSVGLSTTAVAGHTITYSASGLPSGLSINAATGTVSGTIAAADDTSSPYAVAISATDSAGGVSVSTDFSWSVSAPSLNLVNPGSVDGTVGEAVDLPTAATSNDGATLTYSASGLPAGLSIDSATGDISGTVASGADAYSPYAVAITATDSEASLSQTVDFSWSVGSLVLSNPGRQLSLVGDSVSIALASSYSGAGTLVYSVSGLPSGLSIDSGTGSISGTVASGAYASSPYSVTVAVGDGTLSASQTFQWTVKQLILAQPSRQESFGGEPVALTAEVRKIAGDSVTFAASGLPSGLSMDAATGAITGTIAWAAVASSPYTVVVTATDAAAGVSAVRTFQWYVDTRSLPPEPYQPLPANPGETALSYLRRELAHAQEARDNAEALVTFFDDVAALSAAAMDRIVAANPTTWRQDPNYWHHLRENRIATLQASYYQARADALNAYLPIVVDLLYALGDRWA